MVIAAEPGRSVDRLDSAGSSPCPPSDGLWFWLPRLFAGVQSRDQVGNVCELLLEVALIALEPLEDVLAVVAPQAEAAVMSSASVVHVHLPS
jgi:hypothetical protein